MSEAIDWLKPAPLWDLAGRDFADFFTPALLEFRTDDFMDEFFAAAGAALPTKLRSAVLGAPTEGPLKLFQPAHGRYYLVCCSLCCRVPGFPDRVVRGENDERVGFVLRRLTDGVEYAWAGPEGARVWTVAPGGGRGVATDEERMPMAETTGAGGRSLFFGYLPVASGATYARAVPAVGEPDPDGFPDTRIDELGSRFTQPLTGRLDEDGQPLPGITAISAIDPALARTASVYLLLEGWEWFLEHLEDVALVLRGDPGAALAESQLEAKQLLLEHLESVTLGGTLTLAAALGAVAEARGTLNREGGVNGDAELQSFGFDSRYNLQPIAPDLTPGLLTLIDRARDALSPERPPVTLPKLAPRDDVTYVVRCVYDRPLCDETPAVVSGRSLPFRLAPFFDADAPARPIRIPLPGDVSIAGLRKFKKGVSFMMSDAMRRKAESMAGRESAILDGDEPNAEDNLGLAFICSFSIQIIFIVAFMLLIMFVFIFNLFFSWILFFRICFPIPKSLAPK